MPKENLENADGHQNVSIFGVVTMESIGK